MMLAETDQDQKLDIEATPDIPVFIRPQQDSSSSAKEKGTEKAEEDEEEELEISVPIKRGLPKQTEPTDKNQSQSIAHKKIIPRTASCDIDLRDDGSELLSFKEESPIIFSSSDTFIKNHKYLSSPFNAKHNGDAGTVSPILFSAESRGDEKDKLAKSDSKDKSDSPATVSELKRSNSIQPQRTPLKDKSVSKRKQVQTQIHRKSMIMDEDAEKLRRSSILSEGPPKEEDLEAFLEAIVNGRKEVAHSVDPSEIVEMNTRLGAGACGIYDGKTVAIKVFSENNLAYDEQEIRREAALMSVLDHPNLVRYIGACLKPRNMFIITELYPANLQTIINNKTLEFPLSLVLRVSMGISNGMSANILLTSDLDAKITDFGTARVVPSDSRRMMTGGVGTLEFMAPEVMTHDLYTKKADVYSFAIVLWQMIVRKDPYEKIPLFSIPEQVAKGVRPQIPSSCPPKLALLIRSCWNPKPSCRPEFSEVSRLLQVIAGLSPNAFQITSEYYRKCGVLPPGTSVSRITEMQAGSVMLKCGRNGKPHFALFQLSDDSQCIQWTSKKNDPSKTRIKIDDIKTLCLGQHTAVFARSGMEIFSSISFSLISDARTVDIICTSRTEFNSWTSGIRTLLPTGSYVRVNSREVILKEDDSDSGAVVTEEVSESPDGTHLARIVHSGKEDPHVSQAIGSTTTSTTNASNASNDGSKAGEVRNRRRSVSVGAVPRKVPFPQHNANMPSSSPGSSVPSRNIIAGHSDYFDVKLFEENRDVYMVSFTQEKRVPVSAGLARSSSSTSSSSSSSTISSSTSATPSPPPLGAPQSDPPSQPQPQSLSQSQSQVAAQSQPPSAARATTKLLVGLLGKDVYAVACGNSHYAVLTSPGELYMWGNNRYNQQGVYTKPSAPYISDPHVVPFGGTRIRAIACGKNHTLCVSEQGKVFAWGKNERGELGLGNTEPRSAPSLVTGLGADPTILIACGPHTSAAYSSMGDLYMWGQNDTYQLGLDHNRTVTSPQILSATFFTPEDSDVAASATAASITTSGVTMTRATATTAKLATPTPADVAIAGSAKASEGDEKKKDGCDNGNGGNGGGPGRITSMDRLRKNIQLAARIDPQKKMRMPSIPIAVGPVEQLEQLALGQYHSVALTTYRTVWMWGKLGDTIYSVPTIVALAPDVGGVEIACGDSHIAALGDNGCLYTWGDGFLGQLGRGGREFAPLPRLVPQLEKKISHVFCAAGYTAVVTKDGYVYTFGCGAQDESQRTCLASLKDKKVSCLACGPKSILAVVTQRNTPDSRLSGWIPDSEAKCCMACEGVFNAIRRRHHCRKCEGVFCGNCSSWRVPILSKGFTKPVRVCLRCYTSLSAEKNTK